MIWLLIWRRNKLKKLFFVCKMSAKVFLFRRLQTTRRTQANFLRKLKSREVKIAFLIRVYFLSIVSIQQTALKHLLLHKKKKNSLMTFVSSCYSYLFSCLLSQFSFHARSYFDNNSLTMWQSFFFPLFLLNEECNLHSPLCLQLPQKMKESTKKKSRICNIQIFSCS